VGALSLKDFPALEVDPRELIIPHGEGCSSRPMIQGRPAIREDFISSGMYQIAKREDSEWRKQQAEEIREMLFRSLQPGCVKVVENFQIELASDSSLVGEHQLQLGGSKSGSDDVDDLRSASENLEAALDRMRNLNLLDRGDCDAGPDRNSAGPKGPFVPATHKAIYSHSRRGKINQTIVERLS
jgi:hypothetical protein